MKIQEDEKNLVERVYRFLEGYGYKPEYPLRNQRSSADLTLNPGEIMVEVKRLSSRSDFMTYFNNLNKKKPNFVLAVDDVNSISIYQYDQKEERYNLLRFFPKADGQLFGTHTLQDLIPVGENLGPELHRAWRLVTSKIRDLPQASTFFNTVVLLKIWDEMSSTGVLHFRLSKEEDVSPNREEIIKRHLKPQLSMLERMHQMDGLVTDIIFDALLADIIVAWQPYSFTSEIKKTETFFRLLPSFVGPEQGMRQTGSHLLPKLVLTLMEMFWSEISDNSSWLIQGPAGFLDLALKEVGRPIVADRLPLQIEILARLLIPKMEFLNQDILSIRGDDLKTKLKLVTLLPSFGQRITKEDLNTEFELARIGPGREGLYLEQAFKQLEEKGWLLALLPESVLSNSTYRRVREWLQDRFRLWAVISFGGEPFSSVLINIVCLQKDQKANNENYEVFMAEFEPGKTEEDQDRELFQIQKAFFEFRKNQSAL